MTDLARHVVTLLDGVHSRDDVAKSVAREIESGAVANDWMLRLPDGGLNAEGVTAKILRHLRDHGLLVG